MQKHAAQSLSWILQQASTQRRNLSIAFIMAIAASALGLVPYWLIYLLCEQLLSSQPDPDLVWKLCLAALIVTLLRYPLMMGSYLHSHTAAYAVLYHIRSQLLTKLTRIQLGYFNRQSLGATKKILGEDVERIELFIAHHLPDLITALVTPLLGTALLFWADWRLALVSLLPLPVAFLIQKRMFSQFDENIRQFHQGLERLNSNMLQYIKGMQVIRAFNLDLNQGGHLRDSIQQHEQHLSHWVESTASDYAAFRVCMELGLLILVPAGILFVLLGAVDVPILILFLMLGTALLEPLNNLMMFGGMLNRILQGTERVQTLMNLPELSSGHAVPAEQHAVMDINIESLNFRYQPDHVPAINNLSCHIPAGKLTAIVGPSGSGKSTLVRLLLRFYNADAGHISLGGMPVQALSDTQLMTQIATVFQEQYVLNDSVRNNLCMGRGYADDQLIFAAKAAQAHDFIMQLPQQYDTPIGDGGNHLSGGEMQRLTIARAILKDAPIVILDEVTAYADACSEQLIQQALQPLLQGKTVIVIAHRLNSIVNADQILVLDQGQLVGCGSHQALQEDCALYRSLWQAQQKSLHWNISRKDHTSHCGIHPEPV